MAGQVSRKSGVVLLPLGADTPRHERAVHQVLGQKLADLLGTRFLGDYDPARHRGSGYYFVPDETLLDPDKYRALGIRGAGDLFGGLAPYPFMATKAITHPLLDSPQKVPHGWSERFSEQAAAGILSGYTVFDLGDAARAGQRLLTHGPVRVKPVRGKAGRGQQAIGDHAELARCLAEQDAAEVATWGLVLEENLEEVVTLSVGQVVVADLTASYYGTQHLTQDNSGAEVYGGSELVVVRSGYAGLMALPMPETIRLAIAQARQYEQAAFDNFPGLFASRRNYDIAQGLDASGRQCSGVLEQSWRIGGASAAEVFALEAFNRDPSLHCIRASTIERYGDVAPPESATLLYQGEEPELGVLSKYVKVEAYDSPK